MVGQHLTFTLPELGTSSGEGTIVRWLKRAGEAVSQGQPLVEVVTDKVNSELPAPATGTVQQIIAGENAVVRPGAELAILAVTEGGTTPDPASATAPAAPSARPARTSPAVRRLARQLAVDLDVLAGSGPGGRVTRADVERAATAADTNEAAASAEAGAIRPEEAPVAVTAEPTQPGEPGDDADTVLLPLTPMRRAIAQHLSEAARTIPQAWAVVEVDVTALVRWRQAVREQFRQRTGVDLSYLVFGLKAAVEALREWPILNARWTERGVLLARPIHLGVAVAVPDGLVVPVLHQADQLSIAGLAQALHDLITRAQAGTLTVADVQGATFTINNTGALGSVISRSIVPMGQAGILSTEAIVPRAVVRDEAIAIRSMMNVCLAYDHRVLDGAAACGFLQAIKRWLEACGPDTSLY